MKTAYKIYLNHNGFLVINLHLKNKEKELCRIISKLREIRFKSSSKKDKLRETIHRYISDVREIRNFLKQLDEAKPIIEE